jgi:hypothetical protein
LKYSVSVCITKEIKPFHCKKTDHFNFLFWHDVDARWCQRSGSSDRHDGCLVDHGDLSVHCWQQFSWSLRPQFRSRRMWAQPTTRKKVKYFHVYVFGSFVFLVFSRKVTPL